MNMNKLKVAVTAAMLALAVSPLNVFAAPADNSAQAGNTRQAQQAEVLTSKDIMNIFADAYIHFDKAALARIQMDVPKAEKLYTDAFVANGKKNTKLSDAQLQTIARGMITRFKTIQYTTRAVDEQPFDASKVEKKEGQVLPAVVARVALKMDRFDLAACERKANEALLKKYPELAKQQATPEQLDEFARIFGREVRTSPVADKFEYTLPMYFYQENQTWVLAFPNANMVLPGLAIKPVEQPKTQPEKK